MATHEKDLGSAPSSDPTRTELLEEQAVVSKRIVEGETVRVETTTESQSQVVEAPLSRETVTVERIPVGRMVDAAPAVRQEGDVTIVPVMEEVVVVERRLILKEEVRITKVRTSELHRETVELRKQTATVVRAEPEQAAINLRK